MVSVVHDVSNLSMRNLFGPGVLKLDPSNPKKVIDTDYELFRFRVFDSLYKSIKKSDNTREVILAIDDKSSWRKLYWTRYKSHRKSAREKLDFDWDNHFKQVDDFIDEIRTHIPFKVIHAKQAEADDVIGVLALNKPQEFRIISTDQDFLQLYSPRVTIHNPTTKLEMKHPNPELYIIEQCFVGQKKDNIYNIKTPLDWPEDKRKPGYGDAAWNKTLAFGWEEWLEKESLRERFEFNRNLIDFRKIPPTISKRILKVYDEYQKPDLEGIREFFKNHPWPDYVDNFTRVENTLMEVY